MLSLTRLVLLSLVVGLGVLLGGAQPVQAQNHYDLEIVTPKDIDSAPNGLSAHNRVYRAYPGIEYNIRVMARGGCFPYTYALSGHPAGMSIVAGPTELDAGVVTWTPANETLDDADITVTVTDCDGSQTSETWGINVCSTVCTGTGRFYFVDAVDGTYRTGNGGCVADCGDGSLANPWKDLEDVYDGSTSTADIIYFRGCTEVDCVTTNAYTYTVNNMPLNAADNINGEEEIEWTDDPRSTIWLGYPGEMPRVDFAYTGDGCGWSGSGDPTYDCGQSQPRIEWGSSHIYVDHMQFTRIMTLGFETFRDNHGAVFRRSEWRGSGPGRDSVNAAMVTWERHPSPLSYGDVFESNYVTGVKCGSSNSSIKTYDTKQLIIANNTFDGPAEDDINCDQLIAMKGGPQQVTVRQNICNDFAGGGLCIGGNMAESDDPLHAKFSGEILFNVCFANPTATLFQGCLLLRPNATDSDEVFIYRNTFYGTVTILNAETGGGPQSLVDNVIINSDTAEEWDRLEEAGITDPSVVVYDINPANAAGNLGGASGDNIINTTTGHLQGSYATTYAADGANPKGFQIAASVGGGGGAGTRTRSRIRICCLSSNIFAPENIRLTVNRHLFQE